MAIIFHGFTKGVFLGALALLVTSVVSQQGYTCISSTTKVAKARKTINRVVSAKKCRKKCKQNFSCTGFFFDLNKKRCTRTLMDSSGSSKICTRTDILGIKKAHESYFSCYAGVPATHIRSTEEECDNYCKGGDCKGYIYDSANYRCLILNPQEKVMKEGKKNKLKQFCHVVSTFQKAYDERCPCFMEQNLDAIVTDIENGTMQMTDGSCLREDNVNALELFVIPTSNTLSRSYGYASFYSNDFATCLNLDVAYPISQEAALECEALIQKKCDHLFAECCFTEQNLDAIVTDIENGTMQMTDESCLRGDYGNALELYVIPTSNTLSRTYGYASFYSNDFATCLNLDVAYPITKDSALKCEALIQLKCDSLVKLELPKLSCSCFTEDDMNDAAFVISEGTSQILDGSCTINDNNGSISLHVNSISDPTAMTAMYSAVSSSTIPSCSADDGVLTISEEEASVCFDLIQDACDIVSSNV